jgi:hypothetical protein
VPAQLTDGVARDLYGLEAGEVAAVDTRPAFGPAPGFAVSGH